MNNPEPVWLESLRGLLAEVRSPQPGQAGLAKMMAALVELETLLTKNRAEMSPDLIHFLERRSYDKAAKLCGGDLAIPRGTCVAKN
jgi:hypothetical protein